MSLQRLAQPLTLLWVGLAGLLVFTALRGSRDRGRSHPYAEKAPVTDGIPAVRSWNGVRS